jgi:GT2 family glycosyltransferase
MNRTATLILNRNLPKITDQLFNQIKKYNSNFTDIFIIDAGSDTKLLSKKTNYKATWKKAKKEGLRFGRGMNFGLYKLYKENKFKNYDYFLLLTNDSIVEKKPFIKKLQNLMDVNKFIGMLSPCSKKWGEKLMLKKNKLKCFWYIHNNAYFLRKQFIEEIMNLSKPGYMNFLFDGKNFRGYGIESELISKAYLNNWAAAITSEVWIEENESFLIDKNQLIKTEPYNENLKLYVKEGLEWMHKKYGFKSKWSMQMYVKMFYDRFFEINPKLNKYKI